MTTGRGNFTWASHGVELAHRVVIATLFQPEGAPRVDTGLTITADGHWFSVRVLRLGRTFSVAFGTRGIGPQR